MDLWIAPASLGGTSTTFVSRSSSSMASGGGPDARSRGFCPFLRSRTRGGARRLSHGGSLGGGCWTCVSVMRLRVCSKYSTNALVATPGMRVPAYTARGRV